MVSSKNPQQRPYARRDADDFIRRGPHVPSRISKPDSHCPSQRSSYMPEWMKKSSGRQPSDSAGEYNCGLQEQNRISVDANGQKSDFQDTSNSYSSSSGSSGSSSCSSCSDDSDSSKYTSSVVTSSTSSSTGIRDRNISDELVRTITSRTDRDARNPYAYSDLNSRRAPSRARAYSQANDGRSSVDDQSYTSRSHVEDLLNSPVSFDGRQFKQAFLRDNKDLKPKDRVSPWKKANEQLSQHSGITYAMYRPFEDVHSWREYAVGTILSTTHFAPDTLKYADEPVSSSDENSTATPYGHVYHKHRKWIVTALNSDSFQALPIYTHLGRGLTNKRPKQIVEHMSIMDENSRYDGPPQGVNGRLWCRVDPGYRGVDRVGENGNATVHLTAPASFSYNIKSRIEAQLTRESREALLKKLAAKSGAALIDRLAETDPEYIEKLLQDYLAKQKHKKRVETHAHAAREHRAAPPPIKHGKNDAEMEVEEGEIVEGSEDDEMKDVYQVDLAKDRENA